MVSYTFFIFCFTHPAFSQLCDNLRHLNTGMCFREGRVPVLGCHHEPLPPPFPHSPPRNPAEPTGVTAPDSLRGAAGQGVKVSFAAGPARAGVKGLLSPKGKQGRRSLSGQLEALKTNIEDSKF